MPKTFSERKGLRAPSDAIQREGMNAELRNSLWNALDVGLWSQDRFTYAQYGRADIDAFSKRLWFHFFKKPLDARPNHEYDILKVIRTWFFEADWNDVYDFLEWVAQDDGRKRPKLIDYLNMVLEREMSAYRIVAGVVTDITDHQEIAMLEAALADTKFAGATGHLQRAFELLADRDNPDYRNSIKESISAVESMARIVAEMPKATLGDALKVLEKSSRLHPALKDGFLKLYGYTSDEGGIRHAMLDEPEITAADARYFLLSCTSFVNYLKSQI